MFKKILTSSIYFFAVSCIYAQEANLLNLRVLSLNSETEDIIADYKKFTSEVRDYKIDIHKINPKLSPSLGDVESGKPIGKKTPGCPRFDVIRLNDRISALNVNHRTIGHFTNFEAADDITRTAFNRGQFGILAKPVIEPEGSPKPRCNPFVPWMAGENQFSVGNRIIGRYNDFRFSKEIENLQKQQEISFGENSDLGEKLKSMQKGAPSSIYYSTSKKAELPGDTGPAAGIAVRAAARAAGVAVGAASAGVGTFLQPSRIGCQTLDCVKKK